MTVSSSGAAAAISAYPRSTVPAAQRPVQVGVAGVAGGDLPAVGQDDIGTGQVVQGQAVRAAQRPVAAGQGEAGHADRLDGAGDRRQPAGGGGRDDVTGGGTAAGDGGAGGRVDGDAAQRRQVQHQPVVAQGAAGPVVPAAAHRQRQGVLARGADGRGDVLAVLAAGDQRRAVPDRAVPDPAGSIVARVGGRQHAAAHAGA